VGDKISRFSEVMKKGKRHANSVFLWLRREDTARGFDDGNKFSSKKMLAKRVKYLLRNERDKKVKGFSLFFSTRTASSSKREVKGKAGEEPNASLPNLRTL